MTSYAERYERLTKLVGTLWCHSPKATRRGCPPLRVFAIAEADDGKAKDRLDENQPPYVRAWKCELTSDGKLQHPAYKRPLSTTDKRLFQIKVHGSHADPSAMFSPDSFYMPWSPALPHQSDLNQKAQLS